MKLTDILREQPLKNSKHDNIIRMIDNHITTSPNVLTMFKSAYFKISNHDKTWEGDIDYLAMLYDSKKYEVFGWEEVPVGDNTLLLFEVKTNDTSKGYHKALSQLRKESDLIKTFTPYQSINCFYAFGVGKGYSFRVEEEL